MIFKKQVIFTTLAILILVIIAFEYVPRNTQQHAVFTKKADGSPLIISHGGSKLLFPENTMLAFDGSKHYGVDVFEIDVCLTKDNVLIPHHDLTIDRMSDGKGNVRDYTYAELQKFNFGENFVNLSGATPYKDKHIPIPSLEDVIKKYPTMRYMIEIKNTGDDAVVAADQLIRLLEKYDITERTIVASFHDDTLNYVREKNADVMTSTGVSETTKMVLTSYASLSQLLFKTEAMSTQLPIKEKGIPLATKWLVSSLQNKGIAVHYWTINDEETMKQLISIGVDGIITDRPDLLQKQIKQSVSLTN